jgi:hypothetical protein
MTVGVGAATGLGWDPGHDETPAAPDVLEPVQRFLNLHTHSVDGSEAPPTAGMVRSYLVGRGLLGAGVPYSGRDHERVMALHRAIHGRIREGGGAVRSAHTRTIESAADRAAFRMRLAGGPSLEPTAGGIDGALGRLLAPMFLAELDGRWSFMKECAGEACTSVFFDRSRNHSARWCSMRSCGNRRKVRAWRARRRAAA